MLDRFTTRRLVIFTMVISMIGAVAGDAHGAARGRKLNHHLGECSVFDYAVGGEGRWVAYRADDFGAALDALYCVPLDGTAGPVMIAAQTHGAPCGFAEYEISPGAGRLVYRGDLRVDGVVELFSRPLDASEPAVVLSHNLGGWSVLDFAVSADGAWVVYRADDFGGRAALYAVPTDGSTQAVTLAAPVGAGSNVHSFVIGPDSGTIILHADLDTDGVDELYLAPIDGSVPPRRLNHDLGGWSVLDYQLSASGLRLVYRANDVLGRAALYSVRPTGTADPIVLHRPVGNMDVLDFIVTRDGSRVVYRGDLLTPGIEELFSTRTDGSMPSTRLNHALGSGTVLDYTVSASGVWVAYRSDDIGSGLDALYAVRSNGGSPAVQLAAQTGGAALGFSGYELLPDGSRLVWRGDLETDGVEELFSRPVAGGEPVVKLNHDLDGWSVQQHEVGPDGRWVVYTADDVGGRQALYGARPDGGGEVMTLEPAGTAGADVFDLSIVAGGNRVVYRGALDTHGVVELYVTDLVLFGDGFESGDLGAWSASTL
jgi:Tol biopolymer transport system component